MSDRIRRGDSRIARHAHPRQCRAPKAPSDEGAGAAGDRGREKLPLSHAVRVTAPLTRGAFWVHRTKPPFEGGTQGGCLLRYALPARNPLLFPPCKGDGCGGGRKMSVRIRRGDSRIARHAHPRYRTAPKPPSDEGDGCERRRWRIQRATRSGSGQNSVSECEQRILGTATGEQKGVACRHTVSRIFRMAM